MAVEVKVTVKVTESLNSANDQCGSLCQDYSLLDSTVNGVTRMKRKAAYCHYLYFIVSDLFMVHFLSTGKHKSLNNTRLNETMQIKPVRLM